MGFGKNVILEKYHLIIIRRQIIVVKLAKSANIFCSYSILCLMNIAKAIEVITYKAESLLSSVFISCTSTISDTNIFPKGNEPLDRIVRTSTITDCTTESSTINSIFVPAMNSGTVLAIPLPADTSSCLLRPLPFTP
jgi:hypothetical protein